MYVDRGHTFKMAGSPSKPYSTLGRYECMFLSFGWKKNSLRTAKAEVWLSYSGWCKPGFRLLCLCLVQILTLNELFWQFLQYFTQPCEKFGSGHWGQVPKEMHTPEWPNVTSECMEACIFCLWAKVTAFSKSNESRFLKRLAEVLVGMFLKRRVNGRAYN